MTQLVVGLDAGGTRTNVQVRVRGSTSPEFTYEVGDVVSGAVRQSDYVAALRRILAPLESRYADSSMQSRSVAMFLSAAGFTEASRRGFSRALSEVTPTLLGGAVEVFGAANDAVALVLGYGADGAVIAGTGSSVMLRDADGCLHQSGGRGWVASDDGSGFWIGLRGIRQACADWEDRVDSALLWRFRQLYAIREPDSPEVVARFVDLCVADDGTPGEIARFAASVCGAAERGDQVAQDIVKGEAERLADHTARAIRRRFSTERLAGGLTIVECGGLLLSDFYRLSYEAQVQMRLRSASQEKPILAWTRVATGVQAALGLAERLTEDTTELMSVDLAFRPVLVRNGG